MMPVSAKTPPPPPASYNARSHIGSKSRGKVEAELSLQLALGCVNVIFSESSGLGSRGVAAGNQLRGWSSFQYPRRTKVCG